MAENLMTSVKDTAPDESLVPSRGFNNMDLRWLVTEENMGSEFLTFGRTVFSPGGSSRHAMHKHPNAEEVLMVLRGKGVSIVGDERYDMVPGDVNFIPRNAPHSFFNESPDEECEIIFVYGGGPTLEKAGYEVVDV